jgi:hypothetical protein
VSGPKEEKTRVDGATGEWDVELFHQYRQATGERKRMIGSRIILDNTPLIKLLLEQLTRRYRPKPGQRLPPAAKMGGCAGFDKIPWDDAMQAGRIALMKAMESYDPVKSKGRIGFYLAMKFRYELQRLVLSEHLVRVGRGYEKERPDIELTDDYEALDRWSGGECDITTLPEGVTAEDMERWQRTGKWPDELPVPEAIAAAVENPSAPYGSPWWVATSHLARPKPSPSKSRPLPTLTPGWQRFLGRCIFTPSGRTPLWDAYNRYRLDCRETDDDEVKRPVFVEALGARGVRETTLWVPVASPVRGLAGVRLGSALTSQW